MSRYISELPIKLSSVSKWLWTEWPSCIIILHFGKYAYLLSCHVFLFCLVLMVGLTYSVPLKMDSMVLDANPSYWEYMSTLLDCRLRLISYHLDIEGSGPVHDMHRMYWCSFIWPLFHILKCILQHFQKCPTVLQLRAFSVTHDELHCQFSLRLTITICFLIDLVSCYRLSHLLYDIRFRQCVLHWHFSVNSSVSIPCKQKFEISTNCAMFLRMKPRERTDRYAYKEKLQLTSKQAWQHHLAAVNIMKKRRPAKPARPQSHGRRWLSESLQVTRDRRSCRLLTAGLGLFRMVLYRRVWVAVLC